MDKTLTDRPPVRLVSVRAVVREILTIFGTGYDPEALSHVDRMARACDVVLRECCECREAPASSAAPASPASLAAAEERGRSEERARIVAAAQAKPGRVLHLREAVPRTTLAGRQYWSSICGSCFNAGNMIDDPSRVNCRLCRKRIERAAHAEDPEHA